jgi:ribosome-associated translation inhibitor RaiA
MRINVRSEGFQLTPHVRGAVVSRLLSALGQFGPHIELVGVRLQARTGHTPPDTTVCGVAVSGLCPSGDVRARAEDAKMSVAIDRAAEDIRRAVEREVSRLQTVPGSPSPIGEDADSSALDENRISQLQRERLERPENDPRHVRVREYWRPPGVKADAVPKELEPELAAPPRQFKPND